MESGFWHVTCAILVPGILLASWIDYAQRRVPNWLNALLLVLGFIIQGVYFGTGGIATGCGGMLTGFGLLIIPWLMHGMGAGDVKLMAAIGVWLGPMMTFYSFALGAMLGGIAAVVMIISTGRLRMACVNIGVIFAKCSSPQAMFSEFGSAKSFGSTSQLLPYGVPLTGGTLILLAAKVFGWWGI
ncbi:MAG: A24 family peptidase [Phycisphaerales bacterium]|jgi:prepilin peptidase CpaA|nr:A24 family peptidase [Phycisphaerales bacterium]